MLTFILVLRTDSFLYWSHIVLRSSDKESLPLLVKSCQSHDLLGASGLWWIFIVSHQLWHGVSVFNLIWKIALFSRLVRQAIRTLEYKAFNHMTSYVLYVCLIVVLKIKLAWHMQTTLKCLYFHNTFIPCIKKPQSLKFN